MHSRDPPPPTFRRNNKNLIAAPTAFVQDSHMCENLYGGMGFVFVFFVCELGVLCGNEQLVGIYNL